MIFTPGKLSSQLSAIGGQLKTHKKDDRIHFEDETRSLIVTRFLLKADRFFCRVLLNAMHKSQGKSASYQFALDKSIRFDY